MITTKILTALALTAITLSMMLVLSGPTHLPITPPITPVYASSLNFSLQGVSLTNTCNPSCPGLTQGVLMGWSEDDWVPYQLTLDNSGGGSSVSIALVIDLDYHIVHLGADDYGIDSFASCFDIGTACGSGSTPSSGTVKQVLIGGVDTAVVGVSIATVGGNDVIQVNVGSVSVPAGATVQVQWANHLALSGSGSANLANTELGLSSEPATHANGASTWPGARIHELADLSGDVNGERAVPILRPHAVSAGKGTSSVSTTVEPSTSGVVGDSFSDTASVTVSGDSGATPTGTVVYSFFSGSPDCTNEITSLNSNTWPQEVTLDGSGSVPNSQTTGPLTAGSYSFQADYSGDSNYGGSTSDCEPFNVNQFPTPPTVNTAIFVTGTTTPDVTGTSQALGTSVYDTATVTVGTSIPPTGTVTYHFFSDGSCGSPDEVNTGGWPYQVTLNPDGSVPNSQDTGALAAGSYSFKASYSGDSDYLPADGPCETLTILKATPTLTTTVVTTAGSDKAHDTATLSGQVNSFSFNGVATVTYNFYKNGACSGTSPFSTQSVTVASNGAVPDSNTLTLGVGSYSYQATYSGNNNYNSVTSACEPFSISTAKTGALTIGFWQNKNGQGIITSGASISGVCKSGTWLRQYPPFQDLSSTATCSQVATYVTNVIKAATAAGPTMNAMLKAQMLATALDVYFSDPALGGNKIGAPTPIGGISIDLTNICKVIDSGGSGTCSGTYEDTSSAFGGGTCQTVQALLTYAGSKSNVGGTIWYGQVKATQGLAKDTFDAINNQVVFTC